MNPAEGRADGAEMAGSMVVKILRVIMILLAFTFMGCPPPSYNLKFEINGEIHKEVIIYEDSLSIIVSGYHIPRLSKDYVFIKVRFENIAEMESGYCENVIEIRSNRYILSNSSGIVEGSSNSCGINLDYSHKEFKSMDPNEVADYLVANELSIVLNSPSENIYEIKALFDEKWLTRRISKFSNNKDVEK